MNKRMLMRTQQNDVLGELQRKELDPAEFRWTEVTLEQIPMTADEAIVSKLVHTPSGHSFVFDMRGETFWGTFSPGRERPQEHRQAGTWTVMQGLIGEWASNLRRETGAPDLWAEISQETNLARAAAAEDDEAAFSAEERARLEHAVEEIKDHLAALGAAEQQRFDLVKSELDFLKTSIARMSRRGWLHTAVGVLFSIAVGAGFGPDRAKELFGFAWKTIKGAVSGLKLLPEIL